MFSVVRTLRTNRPAARGSGSLLSIHSSDESRAARELPSSSRASVCDSPTFIDAHNENKFILLRWLESFRILAAGLVLTGVIPINLLDRWSKKMYARQGRRREAKTKNTREQCYYEMRHEVLKLAVAEPRETSEDPKTQTVATLGSNS